MVARIILRDTRHSIKENHCNADKPSHVWPQRKWKTQHGLSWISQRLHWCEFPRWVWHAGALNTPLPWRTSTPTHGLCHVLFSYCLLIFAETRQCSIHSTTRPILGCLIPSGQSCSSDPSPQSSSLSHLNGCGTQRQFAHSNCDARHSGIGVSSGSSSHVRRSVPSFMPYGQPQCLWTVLAYSEVGSPGTGKQKCEQSPFLRKHGWKPKK